MARYILFLLLTALGSIIALQHRFVPGIGPFPAWALNLVLGGAAGSAGAALVMALWRWWDHARDEEGSEERLLNAILLALAGAALGAVLYASIGTVFGSGSGSRVAQGLVLAGCVLAGARLGYSLGSPLHLLLVRPTRRPRPRRNGNGAPKLLDTSVIIDGRIGELVQTGFLEGEIVVPEFVLAELQNIADSSNSVRRRKGRRGLDVLRELMEDDAVAIRVSMRDYPDIREVDRKLIRATKEERGVLITTDFNLNRVAQVEGVKILNVNELAQAVKLRFIPGEDLTVEVIDRGEDIGQGVGYLDDGTMVVVENGRRHIGRTIKVTVKSTLQTEAGRMLFAEPAGEYSRWNRR
jgi:predicted nucleic acid-binding protein